MKTRVDVIDAPALASAIREAAYEAHREFCEHLGDVHRQLIETGKAPNGSQRKGRSRRPLWDTGRLKNDTVVEVVNGAWVLRPPPDRDQALIELHAAGYKTVFSELPRDAEDVAQRLIDERVERVHADDYLR